MRPLALTLGEPAGIGPDLALAIWHRRAELDIPNSTSPAIRISLRAARSNSASSTPRRRQSRRSRGRHFRPRCRLSSWASSVTAEPGRPDKGERPRRHRLHSPGGGGRACWSRGGDRYQSGGQEYSLQFGIRRTRPHRVFVRLVARSDRQDAAAGDDAVVAGTCGRAGNNPFAAARHFRTTIDRADRRDGPHRGARSHKTISALRGRDWRSPGSTPMPAKTARWAKKTAPSLRRQSPSSLPRASTRGDRCPPIHFSTSGARSGYDAALCMYHDQALIPIKTLAFDHAVNVTLGLPFVRTSPDHGTAFDIAGTGTADPASLVAALRLAARLALSERHRG